MQRHLDSLRLSNGDVLDVLVVTAPEQSLRDEVLHLLGHKGEPWESHLVAALDGTADPLETRWYLGSLAGRPVSNIMTVERSGVGILGHVFTEEPHRRRGICRAVMERQMADFRERGGQLLLLGTGFESVPYRIYESFGFRSLRDGFMQYSVRPVEDFETAWFAQAPAHIEPAAWEHWPLAAALASRPDQSGLRSVEWGVRDLANLEWPYCRFMKLRSQNLADGVMAVTPTGAVVACATYAPLQLGGSGHAWPGVWLVDAFAHPLHIYKVEQTLAALPLPPGKGLALVPEGDELRVAAFRSAGFTKEGVLSDLVPKGALREGVVALGKWTEPAT